MFLYANVRIKNARRKHTPRDFYVLRLRAVPVAVRHEQTSLRRVPEYKKVKDITLSMIWVCMIMPIIVIFAACSKTAALRCRSGHGKGTNETTVNEKRTIYHYDIE